MPARLIAGSARRRRDNLSSRGWPLLRHMILCGRRMNGLVVLKIEYEQGYAGVYRQRIARLKKQVSCVMTYLCGTGTIKNGRR